MEELKVGWMGVLMEEQKVRCIDELMDKWKVGQMDGLLDSRINEFHGILDYKGLQVLRQFPHSSIMS